MDVRIGTSLVGEVVRFDSAMGRALLVVGDQGLGKTTLARFLTRWWLADSSRHAHVFTRRGWEWSGGRSEIRYLDDPWTLTMDCHPERCLVVLDGVSHVSPDLMRLTPLGHCVLLATAYGAEEIDSVQAVGLMPATPRNATDVAVVRGESRLDWPPDTTPMCADLRGVNDFPQHHWEVAPERERRVAL